ncbi:DUF934 domain-containing protein [Cupriavidus sp. 2KB_3]|uniref:DUF934 domain-containing protein n=1 Tax=Cupriavidus sp. 2KB_3 TaxID=3232980 RepID=UPI003F928DCD
MALIDKAGLPAEDHRIYWQPGQPLPDPMCGVVRLDQWGTYVMQSGASASGIWLAASEDTASVAAMLDTLSLIVIEFPKSRDGRGFTLARMLRERHHFAGDLRAAGPLLPDQFPVLLQCGFTSLLSPPGVPLPRWRDAADALERRQSKPGTLLERLSQG